MGRRKEPQTLEECLAEREYYEDQIRKLENQMKVTRNAESKEARKLRTRRLCREAGTLEHYVPEVAKMDDETADQFTRSVSTGRLQPILYTAECYPLALQFRKVGWSIVNYPTDWGNRVHNTL